MDEELKEYLEATFARFSAENREQAERLFAESRADAERLFADSRAHTERLNEESRRHFGVIAEDLKHEIKLVAEAVMTVDQRLTREVGRLEEKMDSGFSETHALIRFSHADLDGRVRVLEESERTRR